MTGPYTPKPMEAATSDDDIRDVHDARIDVLRAEASEAIGYSANTLRAVIQRYRSTYADEHARWQDLRDELDAVERRQSTGPRRLFVAPDAGTEASVESQAAAVVDEATEAAEAAEAGAEDGRQRALRT